MAAGLAFAASAVILDATPATAQTGAVDDTPGAQRRTQEEIDRASGAAERARLQRLLDSGGDVTYADVLKDPDNIPLNFRFAQTQIRDGNIRGASATLERILLLDPARPDVRLLYAVVLFRLDNLQDAERELLAVRNLPMEETLRAEIEGFLDQIQQRRRRLRFDALVYFGGRYDWNGNSAPYTNTRLVGDVPFTLESADERHREFSAVATARAGVNYDLGLQRRHSLNGAVSGYRAEHLHEDQLDLEVASLEGGAELAYEPLTVRPKLSFSNIRLAHQRYLNLARAETGVAYQVSKKTEVYATAGYEDQQYYSVTVSTTANEKEGRQLELRFGGSWLAEPTVKLAGYVGGYDKNAKTPYNEYHRLEAYMDATFLLSGGRFVIASLTLQQDTYEGPDPFTSADTRHDGTGRARILFGFPLENLFGAAAGDVLGGLVATVSIERYRAVSNLPDYTYRNTAIAAGISRKWNF